MTAITSLWNTVWGYAESANNYYSARDVDIVVVRAGVSNRLTSSLRADLAPRLAALPGVASVDASLTDMVSLGAVPFDWNSAPRTRARRFYDLQLPIGRGQTLGAERPGAVLLGSGIAESLHRQMLQQIEIEGTKFRVAGIFQANNPFDANSIVASIADVQKLMGRPGVVSEFQVRVAPDVRDDAALKQLCHRLNRCKMRSINRSA